ncbi:MAG: hypothetical protein KW804_02220 [Candidatus Doudnabacteria bacterium]|nr:hypothetical protein [Candidatus Doudnabacteria bacterium]
MNKFKWSIVALVVVIVLAAGVWMKTEYRFRKQAMGISDGYQAVFLTNNQVYFGKLSYNHKSAVLTDIYYLQVTQNLQQATNGTTSTTPSTTPNTSSQPKINLVKLGNELHGPQDTMFIERDKILFWENMKEDSKVVQAIKESQSKK